MSDIQEKTKVEYHYAPLTGDLIFICNDKIVPTPDWATHNKQMIKFLELRAAESITLIRTQTYGHQLFHGHSGRVDIYTGLINNLPTE